MNHSWVEVDLGALTDNLRLLQKRLSPQTELMLVLKANAYGHGALEIGRCAQQNGVNWFVTAHLQEALGIKPAVDGAKILVMGVVAPNAVETLAAQHIIPVITSEEHAVALNAEAGAHSLRLPVHVKLDTGMGRLGFLWQEADAVLPRVAALPNLEIQGLCSHFAAVDPDDPTRADSQLEHFRHVRQLLESQVGHRLFAHMSSSRAFLHLPAGLFDAVRIGILLYGYGAGAFQNELPVRPVLQWKTRVIQVKRVPADFPVGYYGTWRSTQATDIATLALGYDDGYLRALSNKGHVLIRGRRCPVVGRVSMNWITVDCGPESGVRVGDEVVLLGRQGAEEIWADELAGLCGTIAYEILTCIHPHLEHHYLG
ncbi:MAG: alanine racemase [Verrucomicrobia bacterium]|nr:MAG: alanine racemase [Verrucomicrobiota bacterium]